MAYDRAGREIITQLNKGSITLPYWMIYDDKEGDVPPVKAANVSIVETAKYVAARLWHTADTLEELAEKVGVPRERLAATVARFNEFAAAGIDGDFGRGDEAFDRAFSGGASPLVSIDQPPFHAAAFGISDLGTKGGLRTDTAARVLDAFGNPIRGLYAAGNTMAAPSGTAYPGGGNPIGTSMLFSHLAVLDMLNQITDQAGRDGSGRLRPHWTLPHCAPNWSGPGWVGGNSMSSRRLDLPTPTCWPGRPRVSTSTARC